MKRVLLATAFLLLASAAGAQPLAGPAEAPGPALTAPRAAARTVVLKRQTLEIGQAPSIWRTIAHYVSFGAVQGATGLKARQPFTVLADHDGVDTDSYTVSVNGTVVQTLPISALGSGVITFAFPQGLAKGTYSLVITAIGAGGTGISDVVAQVITVGPPNKPTHVRVIGG